MKAEGLAETSFVGAAVYYVVVVGLSIISWIIFNVDGDDRKSSRHDRRRKTSPSFLS